MRPPRVKSYIIRTVAPNSHRGPLSVFRPALGLLGLLAFATSACGAPSREPQHPVTVTATIAPASVVPAPARLALPPTDEKTIDGEVVSRLNARVDITEPWKPLVDGAFYLAPDDVVAKDGGVDVVVHFHGATLVEDEWRTTALDAVIVSVNLPGYGVAQYRDRFAVPGRFAGIVGDAVKRVGGTHVRRLGLISWSAGYGAIQDVLSDDGFYAMVDTVVLLDGMHVDYKKGSPDKAGMAVFERFAHDAASGDKQMIVTHSAVTPIDYASTTETAAMLLASVGAARVNETVTYARGMVEWYHADKGGLHVRGFRGEGLRDHTNQAHLLDDAVRGYLEPRWTRLAVLEERATAAIEM
jgi:hypothetical protein